MIEAAIVGLGRWGQSIIEAVQGKSSRLCFVRGISREPELVADFARRHGFALSTELADALGDPRVKAVFLATPHSLHVEQIIAVAATGRPVWCEKPLALTRAEAERAIAAGEIGDVLHIEGHFCNEHSTRVEGGWRDDPRESPGGGMTGAGLHVLDAFINLAGPIATVDGKVFAQKRPPDPRDAAVALVEFIGGATGTLATVRAGPAYWRIHVFGTKGWAEARDETTLTVARLGEAPAMQQYPWVDSLAVLLEDFAKTIETGKPFAVPASDMIEVVGAFEAIIRSIEEGRPVAVQR